MLFTLLVQGLTIQPILQKLNLLGDPLINQQYLEVIARQAALTRVMERLGEIAQQPSIEPEFYRKQVALVEGELTRLQAAIDQSQKDYPDLQTLITEQLQEELRTIEADTYADFVRSGRLNQELPHFWEANPLEQ